MFVDDDQISPDFAVLFQFRPTLREFDLNSKSDTSGPESANLGDVGRTRPAIGHTFSPGSREHSHMRFRPNSWPELGRMWPGGNIGRVWPEAQGSMPQMSAQLRRGPSDGDLRGREAGAEGRALPGRPDLARALELSGAQLEDYGEAVELGRLDHAL